MTSYLSRKLEHFVICSLENSRKKVIALSQFIIRFLLCNLYLTAMLSLLLLVKHIFHAHLSARIQYNIWFPALGLMLVPFLPCRIPSLRQLPVLFRSGKVTSETDLNVFSHSFFPFTDNSSLPANDFTVSVSRGVSPAVCSILTFLWILGMATMLFFLYVEWKQLLCLEKSSLPLQNAKLQLLFQQCMKQAGVKKDVSLYSTLYLKSPVTIGIRRPRIYLPLHLISDYDKNNKNNCTNKDMQYILLHEIQHLHSHDAIPNALINLLAVFYWFNPVIWYIFHQIRIDREIACDTSVLQLLHCEDYKNYGNTLIQFAEKISSISSPFSFVSGLGGSFAQMRKRIIHIASYQPFSKKKKICSRGLFGILAALLLCLSPFLSTYAIEHEFYSFSEQGKKISYIDMSSCFQGYQGSFVLYEDTSDSWSIYHKDYATMRVSPDSTYKIYAALMALEQDVITPTQSTLRWDGSKQPFAAWNADQDLSSAMHNSVNWYFEDLLQDIEPADVESRLHSLSYGNQNLTDTDSYWLESSLKISPIEQVLLLKQLNSCQLSTPETTNAVKNALRLSSSSGQTLYGKTGTGRVNGFDINGWFIGYLETPEHTCYFATNIQGKENATGNKALEITESILSRLHLF